jgi:hypothetical protein
MRREDPQALALYIWATVHGVAMLALDGLLAAADDARRPGAAGHRQAARRHRSLTSGADCSSNIARTHEDPRGAKARRGSSTGCLET